MPKRAYNITDGVFQGGLFTPKQDIPKGSSRQLKVQAQLGNGLKHLK